MDSIISGRLISIPFIRLIYIILYLLTFIENHILLLFYNDKLTNLIILSY